MQMRLQKFMARSGVASRRKSEDIIAEGRVTVNGEKVTEMGVKIDPTSDIVRVDGRKIAREDFRYVKLHKPVGVISSASDPRGRKTVVDFVNHLPQRLYPVGRLDYESRGLILLTNDGELTHILTHPSFEVPKTYQVKARGFLASESLTALESGLELEDGMTAPARVSEVEFGDRETSFKITLQEGRKRQVRRMCRAVGHEVIDLKRIKLGPIILGDLPEGNWCDLDESEQKQLIDLKQQKKEYADNSNSADKNDGENSENPEENI